MPTQTKEISPEFNYAHWSILEGEQLYPDVISVDVFAARIRLISIAWQFDPTVRIGKDVAIAILQGAAGRLFHRIRRVSGYTPKLRVQAFDIPQTRPQLMSVHAIASCQQKLRRRAVKKNNKREIYFSQ
jgi:hypothetical protein